MWCVKSSTLLLCTSGRLSMLARPVVVDVDVFLVDVVLGVVVVIVFVVVLGVVL